MNRNHKDVTGKWIWKSYFSPTYSTPLRIILLPPWLPAHKWELTEPIPLAHEGCMWVLWNTWTGWQKWLPATPGSETKVEIKLLFNNCFSKSPGESSQQSSRCHTFPTPPRDQADVLWLYLGHLPTSEKREPHQTIWMWVEEGKFPKSQWRCYHLS